MPFNIKDTLQKVESYLKASGHFQQTGVGEPKAPPTGKLAAFCWMDRVSVAELTLTTTTELHVVTIRIYKDMLAEPPATVELETARVVQQVVSDLLGDFDLGATIRNVDAGGQYGSAMGANWGYIDVSGKMFRVADITLPLIVDGSATLTQ